MRHVELTAAQHFLNLLYFYTVILYYYCRVGIDRQDTEMLTAKWHFIYLQFILHHLIQIRYDVITSVSPICHGVPHIAIAQTTCGLSKWGFAPTYVLPIRI